MTSAQNEKLNNDSTWRTILALVKENYENRPAYGSTSVIAVYHDGKLANLKSGREVLYLASPVSQI